MAWRKTPEDRRRDQEVYGCAEYKRARAAAKRRANGRCEGCKHPHSRLQCDHIVPAAAAGRPDHSLGNLQMLCVGEGSCKCHEKKTAQEGGGYRAKHGQHQQPARDPRPRPRTDWTADPR